MRRWRVAVVGDCANVLTPIASAITRIIVWVSNFFIAFNLRECPTNFSLSLLSFLDLLSSLDKLKFVEHLSSSTAEQNRFDRLKHNDRIECQALVLDVVKLVLQLLPRVFDRRAVRILDLRPAGQARRDQMPLFVIRNFLSQLGHKMRTLRTRADKAHVAAQDVPELRNLVDANLAYETAHARRAIVFRLCPDRAVLFA